MWIERNKDGKLILFSDKRERNQCCENVKSEDCVSEQMIISDEFAEKYSLSDITFEDGPVEVSLNRCVDYTEDSGIYANCADLGICAEIKRPDNFYLNDETESVDDEISEDFDDSDCFADCCPMNDEIEETNLDKQESENSGLQPQPLKSSDSDVVTTVDRAIEIEALKAKFCGFIPEGETPGETDFNIFSYAYKKGIEHSKNYPEAK